MLRWPSSDNPRARRSGKLGTLLRDDFLTPARRLDCSVPFRNSSLIRESGQLRNPNSLQLHPASRGRHPAARKVWSWQNIIRALQAAVSGIDTHILPIPAVTADEMARSAHLAAFCAIGRTGVVVGFRSSESALAATAMAGLHDSQADPFRTVLRTRPGVVPGFSARAATSRCWALERVRD
jgi:hypothetical protein